MIGATLLAILAGALLCNAIPHLAAGLRGEPFPTPFAKPRGVGLSSPLVNVAWGGLNLVAGVALVLLESERFDRWALLGLLTLGGCLIGTHLAIHFGRVRAGR